MRPELVALGAVEHAEDMKQLLALGWSVALAACTNAEAPEAEAPDAAAALPEGNSDALASAGGAALGGCAARRARLEREMARALDQSATDASITSSPDFTLAIEAADGQRFVHSHGESALDTSYESASTSKWVAAVVILELVDQGVLALDDEPSRWLPYWSVPGVTLARLLSFTSGFGQEPLCIHLPNADFADCVQRAHELNAADAPAPGSSFDYSSTHLQVAGLMALRASGVDSWEELFDGWRARTGLFPTGAFDLPSLDNPRLAGGMHWTASEYLDFLRALYDGVLLQPATQSALLDNQRGSATVTVAASPVLAATGQDWAYGFGNWLECAGALGPNSFDCGPGHRNSSPGAYGAYPFIDFDHQYVAILARQGELGTFREGVALFEAVAEDAARWADACSAK
ncbi:MAG TPA: serine hydrolase domain-containing protein [Polyangiaceae bacterium]|nr:serine hydrolase domain-containing protein [Polyangiaceae bacterium]